MSPPKPTPGDEEFSRLLAACDEALAAGEAAPTVRQLAAPPELSPRLERACACLLRLERARLRDALALASANTPLPSDCLTVEVMPPPVKALGRFEVRRELGRGGGGIVFLAFDPLLRREVAVKVPRPEAILTPELRQRFLREARAAAGLEHPNLVTVHEVGEDGPLCYLVSIYCRGPSLSAWLKQQREAVPPRDAAALVATLADAVHFMHGRGIIHRDIKPGNILLVSGDGQRQQATQTTYHSPLTTYQPKLTDFGLARPAERDDVHTRTGSILGTPAYMAPEQAAGGENVGPAADVYALGVLLYELLTGQPPFKAGATIEVLRQVMHEEPVPPRWLRAGLSRDLETVCLKCLEKEPKKRYDSARALAEELQRFQEGRPVLARPVSQLQRLGRWCCRNPTLAWSGGLTAALLVITAFVSTAWAVHADRLAGALQQALTETEQEQLKTQEQMGERLFEHALVQCERGDVGIGMLWMARSLETIPERAEVLGAALRASLASWRSEIHTLTDCRSGTGEVLAFGPDGKTAWTADADGSVCQRKLTTGKQVGPPLLHKGKVAQATACRDRSILLTATVRAACLWDTTTGKPRRTFRPQGQLEAVALSPDGRAVFTAESSLVENEFRTTIRRWETGTGQQLAAYHVGKGIISALAISPDGRSLVGQDSDGTLKSWETGYGKFLGQLCVPRGGYRTIAYSPDGRYLLTGGGDQSARLWEVSTGRLSGPPLYHRAVIQAVGFSPDGKIILTGDAQKTIRTWAVAQGPALDNEFPHNMPVRSVAFSPDGQTVATGSFDRKARLWDIRQGRRWELPHGTLIDPVLFSPDGRLLLTAAFMSDSAVLWDIATGQPREPRLKHNKHVAALAFSRNGELAATGSYDGTARIWDVASGTLRATINHGEGVVAVGFSPQGDRLITGSEDSTARVWDISTARLLVGPLRHNGSVRAVAFSPDGERLLTASADGTARLWIATTGQPMGNLIMHGGGIWVARFSPDGRRLLTGSWDGTARLWDAASGQSLSRPFVHEDQIRSAVFSSDGRIVATGSLDGTARLWDAATGRPIGPRWRHEGKVWAVAFGAKDQMLLTGSEDCKARLFRVPQPLAGPVGQVVLWTELLTGMRLDEKGGVHVLDPLAWREIRRQLQELTGVPST
jgi:WD40 repeat protein